MITTVSDYAAASQRRSALDKYLSANVLSENFACTNYAQCSKSHSGAFYEGQLHHVGAFYDLRLGVLPFRAIVVGQEYGQKLARVSSSARSTMIMESAALDYRRRNPHMRGTTNVLRLLFGLPLSADHDSEFMAIDNKQVHLFECMALVNYLLCSAIANDGKKKGLATSTMKQNCQTHFREVIRILEPTVIIVQGKGFWDSVRRAFDSVEQQAEEIFSVKLGSSRALVATFTHPSSHFPHNWGANERTPYLLNTVDPTIKKIRLQLLNPETLPQAA